MEPQSSKGKGKNKGTGPPPPPKGGARPPSSSSCKVAPSTMGVSLADKLKAKADALTHIELDTHDVALKHIIPHMFARFGSDATSWRILAYGDSLTAGYHSGTPWAPYGEALHEELLQLGIPAEVWVCGQPSRSAKWMVDHISSEGSGDEPPGLRHLLETKGPFDMVLIQCGSHEICNDLAEGHRGIFDSIKELHVACHALGIASMAFEIPDSLGISTASDGRSTRDQTNALVRDWAAGCGCTYVETTKLIPWVPGDSKWDDDGLHFSPVGSQCLGKALARIITDQRQKQSVSARE